MNNQKIIKAIIDNFLAESINNAKIGYHNNNYTIQVDDNKYILRVPVPDFDTVDIKIFDENDILQFLTDEKVDISHPEFIGNAMIDNTSVSVHSFIEGKSLKELYEKNTGLDSHTIEKFAEMLSTIHNVKKCPSGKQPYSDVHSFYDYNYYFISKLVNKYFALYKDNLFSKLNFPDDINSILPYQNEKLSENEFCLCHNDFHSGNIIVNNDSFSLIDWELTQFTDPCYDIAIHFNKMRFTKEQEDVFVNKYLSIHNYDKEQFLNQIKVYRDLEIVKTCIIDLLRMVEEFNKYDDETMLKKVARYMTKLKQLEQFDCFKMPTDNNVELFNLLKDIKIDLYKNNDTSIANSIT